MFKRFVLPAVLLLVSSLFAIAWISPANAHAVLTDVNPKDGEVLTELPHEVVFTFNEELKEPGFAAVSRDGEAVTDWTYALDAERLVVIPPQDVDVLGGEYKVSFRVVSADGHPIKGSTAFTLNIENSVETPDVEAQDDSVGGNDEEMTESDESEGLSTFLRAPWVWGAIIVIIAFVAVTSIRRRSKNDDPRT